MARTWLSIRVELVQGLGGTLWPRPGRVMAAARTHTFAQLGTAIDDAFARWDLGHLSMFRLPDESVLHGPIRWGDPAEEHEGRFAGDVRLSGLSAGERFVYIFDMGDGWTHLCTVGKQRIDPLTEIGEVPNAPVPYWGWGAIPDQYGRRFDEDDGEGGPVPPDPRRTDLPPIHPGWGGRGWC
ncbi:MAG: hypothetical protein AB7G37_11135 [Solirubrobacteraceae bacterium]